jgi:hypothetical protein
MVADVRVGQVGQGGTHLMSHPRKVGHWGGRPIRVGRCPTHPACTLAGLGGTGPMSHPAAPRWGARPSPAPTSAKVTGGDRCGDRGRDREPAAVEDTLAPPSETVPTVALALSPEGHRCQPEPAELRRTRAQRPIAPPLTSGDATTSSQSGKLRQARGALMFDPGMFPGGLPTPSVTPLRGAVASGVRRCGVPRSIRPG